MGNGNKFRLSNVLPNVFSKIKGVGPRKITGRSKGSDTSSTALTAECDQHLDQNVYRFGNRKSAADRDRSVSPSTCMFSHTTTHKIKDPPRHSLSPHMVSGAHQRTYDIRFPVESPVRNTRGNQSRSHSPPPQYLTHTIQNSTAQSDPGCCSFDSSTLALVPHVDGRQRREFSPVFGRCAIMAKCNSFRGSTHSDSEISETDTTSSRAHSRRHLRNRSTSAHLGASSRRSCYELEGCCHDSGNHLPGAKMQMQKQQQQQDTGAASSIRRGSNFRTPQLRKDRSPKMVDRSPREQLYGGSSPVHSAAQVAETRILYNSSNSPAAVTAATYYGRSAAQIKDGARDGLGSAAPDGGVRAETPRSRSRERSRAERNQHQRHAQTPPDSLQLQFKDRGSSRKLSFVSAGAGVEPASRQQHVGDVDTSFSSEDEVRNAFNVVRGGSKDCSSNAKVSLSSNRSRASLSNIVKPQRMAYSRVDDVNRAEYMSREMVLELETGDDMKDNTKVCYQAQNRNDAASQRESVLAKTVLDAREGWARRQLSKFSQDDELHHLGRSNAHSEPAAPRRYSSAGVPASAGLQKDGKTGSWPEENVLAIVRLEDPTLVPAGGRVVSLSKLRDMQGDQARVVFKKDQDFDDVFHNKDEKSDRQQHQVRTFRSPPHSSSRDFPSLKSPKTPSPIGEVEKRTEGRIAYKSSSSPSGKNERGRNLTHSKPKLLSRVFADEELSSRSGSSSVDGKCGSGAGDDTKKFESARMKTDVKEIGIPWDADFPSFRSDSMLMGAGGGVAGKLVGKMGGSGRVMSEERVAAAAAQVEFFEMQDSKAPPPQTPRNMERQRQSKIGSAYQDQETPTRSLSERNSSSIRSKSPAPRDELTKAGIKPFRAATPSKSPSRRSMPELSSSSSSTRQCRTSSTGSPCSTQEFSSTGKKLPNRSPSPIQDANSTSKRHTNGSPLRLSGQGTWQSSNNNSDGKITTPTQPPSQGSTNSRSIANKLTRRSQSPAQDQSPTSRPKRLLSAKAEAGMQRLDSVAVVKASYDPYNDFRESMVEMILENDIRTAGDLEDLLQCYLSLNLSDYHKVIVQVFTDIWGDIFDQ